MEPMQVGGHVGRGLIAVRVIAILGLIAGVILYFVEPVAGVLVFILALLMAAIVETALFLKRQKRCWVTDTGEGFVVRDRLGERSHDDDDVFSVELEAKKIYSQGVYKGLRRKFRMKVEGEAKPIDLDNVIPEGKSDGLGDLIQRLIAAYRSGADDALREGAVVQGKNWSLSHTNLTINANPSLSIPLTDLASVGVFDDEVCVWKKGSDTAVLKTPVRSQNAFLLELLLQERLADREPDEEGATEGLGRVLFERKGSRVISILLWGVIVLLLFPAVGALLAGIAGGQPGVLVVGLLILGLCGLCAWGARANKRTVFRCHERGVFKQGSFSSAQLRYEEVGQFTYSATRQYYNGAYIGTALNLALAPRPESGKKPIRFSRTVKNVDESLDNLRDHISLVLANDMLRRLSDGERVTWTSNLALLPEGIEYRPSGFVKRKPPTLLAYKDVHNFDLQQGTFHLWERGKDKSVMQETVGQANFFPGYFALARLYAQDGE